MKIGTILDILALVCLGILVGSFHLDDIQSICLMALGIRLFMKLDGI